MSDRMTCMPFSQLLDWVLEEKSKHHTVFGIHTPYIANPDKALTLFGHRLETPIGPAAGPATQLAQNIVASYFAGGRFFEVKTIQILDGEDLPVSKPCILAADEGYNVEWSTELYVPQAQDEYIKAWVLLHLIAKEYGLGAQDGFQFNMSVGYDLAGIKTEKIDTFIESLKDAKNTACFKEAIAVAKANLHRFERVTAADIDAIPAVISPSVTISTLHGCPPQEIESIATYLLTEKHLHTFIKCNPTLLGFDFARKTMDAMGYDYLVFGEFHFDDDLQYEDAIPMLKRLMALAEAQKLAFGVKITNTFPVDIKANELPGNEMYMSGKALFPLSISLAAKLSREFDGKLRISYSGGADAFNLERIVAAGVWPVTIATTILKPGGYQRFKQLAELLDQHGVQPFTRIDANALTKLAEEIKTDPHYMKSAKMPPNRKNKRAVPLLDCFIAPCEEGCPIHQDIPTYLGLSGKGKFAEALQVILDKNALPFMTGNICAHPCMSDCVRNVYETPVNIRGVKLDSAHRAIEEVLPTLKPRADLAKTVAVVGGGPAGMAAAFYLARAGAKVSIFEKREKLGGLVTYVIPDFRINEEEIALDISLLKQLGVTIHTNREIHSVAELKAEGYDDVVIAVGAYEPGLLDVTGCTPLNAISFLEDFNRTHGKLDLGRNVVVIGAGNTAMDVARAAKVNAGVENVYLVYRRTKRYMPADEEELLMALEDGVIFKELLAPERWENGQLICKVMKLGDFDASGRRGVVSTDETIHIPADSVIVAVGEHIPGAFYQANGIQLDEKGRPNVDKATLESNLKGVYIVGDGLYGPATIVEAMRDSTLAANAILNTAVTSNVALKADKVKLISKRGILLEPAKGMHESNRCVACSTICENCVEVCPNRANISVTVPGREMAQIVHVDFMCNECGNCETFCPWNSAPYKAKFTLFANEKDMEDSTNDGFLVIDKAEKQVHVRYLGKMLTEPAAVADLPAGLTDLIHAVINQYTYMIF